MRGTLGAIALTLGSGAPQIEVGWLAPDACVGDPALRERIERRVSGRLENHARLVVDARVQALEAERLVLTVQVDFDGDRTVRSLEASSCKEVEDAVVLITSLAVGSEADELPAPDPAPPPREAAADISPPASEASPPDRERVPPREPAAEPASQPQPTRPSRARARLWGELGLGAGAAWGQVPGIGPLVVARGALGRPRWLVRLGAGYAPPRRALLSGFDDRGGIVQGWYASLDAGPRWSVGDRVTIPITVGLEAGALHGEGFGVLMTRRAARPWVAGRATVETHVRVTRGFGPWIAAELAVPFGRPAFEIVDRAVVFRSAPVSPRVLAGVVIRWE